MMGPVCMRGSTGLFVRRRRRRRKVRRPGLRPPAGRLTVGMTPTVAEFHTPTSTRFERLVLAPRHVPFFI